MSKTTTEILTSWKLLVELPILDAIYLQTDLDIIAEGDDMTVWELNDEINPNHIHLIRVQGSYWIAQLRSTSVI